MTKRIKENWEKDFDHHFAIRNEEYVTFGIEGLKDWISSLQQQIKNEVVEEKGTKKDRQEMLKIISYYGGSSLLSQSRIKKLWDWHNQAISQTKQELIEEIKVAKEQIYSRLTDVLLDWEHKDGKKLNLYQQERYYCRDNAERIVREVLDNLLENHK